MIISSVKSRIRRITHKYGHEIPRNLEHVRKLDLENGNDFWRKAIEMEMLNVGIAFEVLEDTQDLPVGWKPVLGNINFDIKMALTRDALWVINGHLANEPSISTYAGIVSRESVRIAITYAAPNGVDVTAADTRNA